VSQPRDKLLVSGGILIGLGAGLCLGIAYVIASVAFLLHHMLIVGIQWPRILVFAILPVLLLLLGASLLVHARRIAS
jgi:hypothetical protein